MKKLNKVAALALATVMGLSMTACGNGNGTTSQGGTTSVEPGTTTVSDSGAVVIDVYRRTFNLGAVDDAQVKKVEDAINAYIADKINVQIVLHDIADYLEGEVVIRLVKKTHREKRLEEEENAAVEAELHQFSDK